MEVKVENVKFEEMQDSEIEEIWNIFFPGEEEKTSRLSADSDTRTRRHLKFLAM